MNKILEDLNINFNTIDKINQGDIIFVNPELLYLLLIIPFFLMYYYFYSKKQLPTFNSSNFVNNTDKLLGIEYLKFNSKSYLRNLLPIFKSIAIGLIIIALARPQSSSSRKEITTNGIDIVMALDVSTSMLAEDLKPNRIEAAKKTAIEFVENRKNDRIGLVIFSGESYTSCPITTDHTVLINLLSNIKSGIIADGTAIGLGLSTAVSRLKESKAKSKVIVLLTDGSNNAGNIAPETAAEIALVYGIKVYTIAVGTKGMAPYPMQTPYGKQFVNVEVEIDEELLKKIANNTNGEYFRATNNKSLKDIYDKINKLETSKVEQFYYTKKTEEFTFFVFFGILFLILEILLNYTYFRTLP